MYFFFNDTATTEIYTLSLHDALPISRCPGQCWWFGQRRSMSFSFSGAIGVPHDGQFGGITNGRSVPSRLSTTGRSEEHTSELQSRQYLVCRLLLEKKKNNILNYTNLH